MNLLAYTLPSSSKPFSTHQQEQFLNTYSKSCHCTWHKIQTPYLHYKFLHSIAPATSTSACTTLPSSAQYDSASRTSFLFQKDVKSFPTSAVLHVCLFTGIFSLLWIVPGLQKVLNKYLLNEWINAALCLLSPSLFVWVLSSHSLRLGLRHLLKIPSLTHCLNRAPLHHSTATVFLLHLFVCSLFWNCLPLA